MNMPVVEISGLRTAIGGRDIHRGLDLDIGRGQILGLVGGSGSGKTTLLRQIIGLMAPTAGSVRLFGGMVSANLQLGLSFDFFLNALPRAVPAVNLLIGLSKGAVFGLLIALVACHFGLRVRPNTESLSANTTRSVVTSITLVILLDALFAIATKEIGVPQL